MCGRMSLSGSIPGAISDELDTLCGALEHAALCHVVDRLSNLRRIAPAERDLLDALDEFLRSTLSGDTELAIFDLDFEPASRESTREAAASWRSADVDEASGARETAAEAADVDVSIRVRLRHAETREVEPSAIVEVELLVLMDDSTRD